MKEGDYMAKNIWYICIERYYKNGTYTKQNVAFFVVKGKITAAEYEEIVGEPLETEE